MFIVLTSLKILEGLGSGIGTGLVFCLSFSVSINVITVSVIHGYLKKGTYAVWIAYHHLVLNFIPSALSCFWNDVCCLSLEDCHYVS